MNRTFGLSILALVLLQGATGCIYSEDRDVFKSTYEKPKTVSYIYKPSNETAWTFEIPPQTLLVVERDATTGNAEFVRLDQGYPTKLIWELYPIDASPSWTRKDHYWGTPLEKGTLELNGSPGVIAWTLRDPIDPNTLPKDRPVDEIEKDLPEPDAKPADQPATDAVPEPTPAPAQ